MKHRLALLVLAVAGCRATPPRTPLPRDHPAHPMASTSAYDPQPSPFVRTPAYVIPGVSPRVRDERVPHEHERGSGDDAPVVYSCPMHPEVREAEPGKCPECGMALRPVPADARGHRRDEESRP